MAEQGATEAAADEHGRGEHGRIYSAVRAVVQPYWILNLYPITYATVAMLLAAVEVGWSWTDWGLLAATIWFIDNGLHDFDLADDTLAVNIDAQTEFLVGIVQILLGIAVGVYLATVTTTWFLVVVALATVFGMAYNLEWFDGRLHDRQYVTGVGNFAFVVGWLSCVSGYLVAAEALPLGAAVFALGPMLHVASLQWIEEEVKPVKYDYYGVEHAREERPEFRRLQRRAVKIVPINLAAFGAMAVGLFMLIVV